MLEAYPSNASACKHKHYDFRAPLCSGEAAVLVVGREESMSGTLASIFRSLADIENLYLLTVQ